MEAHVPKALEPLGNKDSFEGKTKKSRYGHGWTFSMGMPGLHKQLVEPTAFFLLVTKHKGSLSEANIFQHAGRIINVMEQRSKKTYFLLQHESEPSQVVILLLQKDFELQEVNPLSTQQLFEDAIQTRGLVS